MKTLIVDDSSAMLRVIKMTLNEIGIDDIDTALNGKEAIEKFEQGSYELLLTDWNMPEMDGISLVRRVRELDTDVYIVMVTTECKKEQVVEALEAGVDNYVTKPFSKKRIQKIIEEEVKPKKENS
jgi:two-component system chemotaxis response regulator CheY